MRKLVMLLGVGALLFVLVGCAGMAWAPVIPPAGWVYTDTKAPVSTEFDKAPVTTKYGMSYTENVLGLVAWGDASLDAAAKAGGLSTINYVDYQMFNVLGIYSKFTTVVYGE